MSNSTNENVSTVIEGSYPSTSAIPRSLAMAVFVMLSILILAGASGNAYVYNLLRRRRDLRKVPHYLLGSLSLTGVLTSLFSMSSLLIATIVNYLQVGHSPVAEILCKVGFPLTIGCVSLDSLNVILMTIDRHDCVVRPFSRRLSTQNVQKILLFTWLVSFIIAAVLLVLIRKEISVCYTWFPYNQPKAFQTEQGNFILIYLATIGQLGMLAIVLVIITFLRVVKTLRAPTILQSTNSSIRQRQERQLTWLTYGICGNYILFKLPLLICSMVGFNKELQGTTLNTAMLVTATMMYSLFVLNPILHFKIIRVRRPNRVLHVVPQVPQAQID